LTENFLKAALNCAYRNKMGKEEEKFNAYNDEEEKEEIMSWKNVHEKNAVQNVQGII